MKNFFGFLLWPFTFLSSFLVEDKRIVLLMEILEAVVVRDYDIGLVRGLLINYFETFPEQLGKRENEELLNHTVVMNMTKNGNVWCVIFSISGNGAGGVKQKRVYVEI